MCQNLDALYRDVSLAIFRYEKLIAEQAPLREIRAAYKDHLRLELLLVDQTSPHDDNGKACRQGAVIACLNLEKPDKALELIEKFLADEPSEKTRLNLMKLRIQADELRARLLPSSAPSGALKLDERKAVEAIFATAA